MIITSSGYSRMTLILSILLLTSLLINGWLLYGLKEYHSKFRQAIVFPTHENKYQLDNAKLPPKQQQRIVLFGDSRIQEWENLPKLDNWEWINRGIGGETTAQLRARFAQDVLALSPDVVILQMGINDLVAIGALPEYTQAIKQQCQNNLQWMVDTLKNTSINLILLSIIPPAKPSLIRLPVWSKQISQSVEDLNQYWLNLPANEHFQVIDTKKVLQDDQGQWQVNVNRDTLHFTPTGYNYLNQAVITALSNFTLKIW